MFAFLPREENQLALKTEIKQLAFSLAATNMPAEAVVAQPTPAKISKLSRSKGSDEDALSFFLNTDQCADEVDQSTAVEIEVQRYFSEKTSATERMTDPLEWWGKNEERFPFLSQVALRVLCTPATSVPSERVFSSAGLIVNKLRSMLMASNIDALIFLHANDSLHHTCSRILDSLPATVPRPVYHPRQERMHLDEVDDQLPDLPSL